MLVSAVTPAPVRVASTAGRASGSTVQRIRVPSTTRSWTPGSAPSSGTVPETSAREAAAPQVPQLREAAGLHRAALADDRHPVGEALDLAEDVAGQQHGGAGRDPLGDARGEHLLHQRVEPGGRLVEHQQVDVGGERRDQRDLLPVALGVGPAAPWWGRAGSVPAAPRGAPRGGRRRACAAAGRSSRRPTGWATGRRRRARRPAGGGWRRRRARGRARRRWRCRRRCAAGPAVPGAWWTCPRRSGRGSRAPRRAAPRGRGRRGPGPARSA